MEWKRQIYLQTGHGITEARNHHNTGPRSSVFLVRVAFIAEPKTWVNTYIYSCYFITQVLCWRVEPFSSFGYASVFLNTRTSIHCQQRSKLYWLEFCFITGNERTIILILRWPKSIGWGHKLCYAVIFLFCGKDGYNLQHKFSESDLAKQQQRPNHSRWHHGSPWIYRGICLVGLLFVLY